MATFQDVETLVKEFEGRYRGNNLPPFELLDKYEFGCKLSCPPLAARRGVYAIFCDEKLLYIGKASSPNSAIWHRIYTHINFDDNFDYIGVRGTWSLKPSHFIGWAVPDESFFEASALEEFLIYQLRDELPDNRVGK